MQPYQSDCNSGDEMLLLSPLSNPSLSNFHPQRQGGADPSTLSPHIQPEPTPQLWRALPHSRLAWNGKSYSNRFFPGRATAHDLMPSPRKIHLNECKRIFACLKCTYFAYNLYIYIHTYIHNIYKINFYVVFHTLKVRIKPEVLRGKKTPLWHTF